MSISCSTYLLLLSSQLVLEVPRLVHDGAAPRGVAVTPRGGCHLHLMFYVVINVLLLLFDVRTVSVDPGLCGLVPGRVYVGPIGFKGNWRLQWGRACGGQLLFQRGHFFFGQCGSLEQKRNFYKKFESIKWRTGVGKIYWRSRICKVKIQSPVITDHDLVIDNLLRVDN